VNNAGVSIYGRITDVPLADARRLFETNYWGLVHGSLVAVPHLRARAAARSSTWARCCRDTTMPLQGHYSASKHAVKGFTDALRIELEEEDAPVAVCSSSRRRSTRRTRARAPTTWAWSPSTRRRCTRPRRGRGDPRRAEHPRRDVKVGGSAKMFTTLETFAPRLADRFKQATSFSGQRGDEPARADEHALRAAAGRRRERGEYPGHVMHRAPTRSPAQPGGHRARRGRRRARRRAARTPATAPERARARRSRARRDASPGGTTSMTGTTGSGTAGTGTTGSGTTGGTGVGNAGTGTGVGTGGGAGAGAAPSSGGTGGTTGGTSGGTGSTSGGRPSGSGRP
jgi:hypothetical protein